MAANKPKPQGRPSKCNPDRTKTIADELADGASIDAAARTGRISPRTYHNWIERGELEEQRLEAENEDAEPLADEACYLHFLHETARALAIYEAELVGDIKRVARGYELQSHNAKGDVVYSTAIDWRAGAWLLERKFPDRYGSKQRLEHTGAEGGPIRSESAGPDVSKLPLEKRRQLLELLAEAEAAE